MVNQKIHSENNILVPLKILNKLIDFLLIMNEAKICLVRNQKEIVSKINNLFNLEGNLNLYVYFVLCLKKIKYTCKSELRLNKTVAYLILNLILIIYAS